MVQGAQMAKASGVGFSIHLSMIEKAEGFDELFEIANQMGAEVLEWILQGGEDHVLLATGVDLPGIAIGSVFEGSGISLIHNMKEIKMAPVSWSHFS